MTNIPENPREVVETALQFELEGRKILVDAGEKAKDPLSKATFKFLADQELKHIDAIKAYACALDEGKTFSCSTLGEHMDKSQAMAEIQKIFSKIKSEYESVEGKEDERQEVYEIAMDMERRGHDFYEKAASQTTNDTSRQLFQFLTGEETNHFEIIQETAEFLKQPDAIMAVEERWMQF
jgi:rubrerythrin